MDKSKQIRTRLSYTILITVGATYILSILVAGLLMNVTTVTVPIAQGIRLMIAVVIGFSVWNILKRNEQQQDNKK